MGVRAATMLMERIRGLDEPAREVVLPVVIGDETSGLSVIDGRGPS
jgi:DNA-binding LacI/PurR family transcriptional regulator